MYGLVEWDIVWLCMEVVFIRCDIGVIQVQCQVVVVVFVLVFQLGVGGGFDYFLDKLGLGNVLYVLCFCKFGVVRCMICRLDKVFVLYLVINV